MRINKKVKKDKNYNQPNEKKDSPKKQIPADKNTKSPENDIIQYLK